MQTCTKTANFIKKSELRKKSIQDMADDRLIPAKANRVLNLILLALLLIFVRVWYLTVIQYDELLEQSRKPQRRSLVEHTERATIRDRFNIPLAINKIQYKAAIYYADIKQIPQTSWVIDETRVKKKIPSRSLYITELSQLLGKELALDPERVEDLIHSKASLFPFVPYFIKEELSETEYYRLKMLEKDWAGIYVTQGYKRVYPRGKTASDIVGYLGAISDKENLAIAQEMKELKDYLDQREKGETPLLPKGFSSPLEVRDRLKKLKEKSYTINDVVGKAGIEGALEEKLRGFYTKKHYEVDRLGTILRELPGSRKAISGQRVILSLSAELQEFAESLLALNETKPRSNGPWIRGGAIVAMIPTTGEVVALASYPRFNPNDFIEKRSSLLKWIENEALIGELWDGKQNLEKEGYSRSEHSFKNEELPITWENFLALILEKNNPIFKEISQIHTIKEAIEVQKTDKEKDLLTIDLCRLVANHEDFSEELLHALGSQSIAMHRKNCQIAARVQGEMRAHLQKVFHKLDFKKWRATYFKEYLQNKRKEEKENKKYPRPYIEYLDSMEKRLFQEFWEKNRLYFLDAYFSQTPHFHLPELTPYFESLKEIEIKETLSLEKLSPDLAIQYLKTLRTFNELKFPLRGKYKMLRNFKKQQTGKDLAAGFYPLSGYGYGRSQAYRQSTPQGSLFKLIVAYEALIEKYQETAALHPLNPFTLIDDLKSTTLGYHLNGEAITRNYKGGRMPRSSHAHIGKVDLMGAIEQSSNIYFSVLASEVLKDPAYLTEVARQFGFGKKTGFDLPGEIAGNLPDDLNQNKTGIYSFAIGQHSLVVTPLQTAVMLSCLANGGDVLKPKIVQTIAGNEPSEEVDHLFSASEHPFKEELSLLGIHFPLFTEALINSQQSHVKQTEREVLHRVNLPSDVRTMLLESMRRVVSGTRGTARPAILRQFFDDQKTYQDYLNIHTHLVGKTGTAEILYKSSIDTVTTAKIENHVWFGGIAFDRPIDCSFNADPELVVVVYLKFGGGGKEAAPLAAQIIQKWREIQQKHRAKIPI